MAISSTTLGPFEIFSIEAGHFRLDGGSMFGVVPKTLWEPKIPADDKNRIPMSMRCLLIKSNETDRLYLIDNGSGSKFNEKMTEIYQLDYSQNSLLGSLNSCAVSADELTDMVFTHLHFDHCGGTTYYENGEEIRHQFPNARYWVNRRHLETALHPNAREKASFMKDNIEPIAGSDRLTITEDYHIFEKGFYTIPADGHTIGQQLPVLEAEDKKIVYAADLIPTHAHIPLPWVMGFDMAPLQTLKEKETFLKKAIDENWFLFLEHDREHELITVKKENGKYSMGESLTLDEI
ncbi:MAG: MBL fold metallo-hydrolase [Balneolaceae bacterium]